MTVENTAWWHLRNHQKQCDPEGIEVQVSRQALDETLDEIELSVAYIRIAHEKIAKLQAVLDQVREDLSYGDPCESCDNARQTLATLEGDDE